MACDGRGPVLCSQISAPELLHVAAQGPVRSSIARPGRFLRKGTLAAYDLKKDNWEDREFKGPAPMKAYHTGYYDPEHNVLAAYSKSKVWVCRYGNISKGER